MTKNKTKTEAKPEPKPEAEIPQPNKIFDCFDCLPTAFGRLLGNQNNQKFCLNPCFSFGNKMPVT